MTLLSKKEEIERRLNEIEKERNTLLQELTALPSVQEPSPFPPLLGAINSESPPVTSDERIALFTRLFRCREDLSGGVSSNMPEGCIVKALERRISAFMIMWMSTWGLE